MFSDKNDHDHDRYDNDEPYDNCDSLYDVFTPDEQDGYFDTGADDDTEDFLDDLSRTDYRFIDRDEDGQFTDESGESTEFRKQDRDEDGRFNDDHWQVRFELDW